MSSQVFKWNLCPSKLQLGFRPPTYLQLKLRTSSDLWAKTQALFKISRRVPFTDKLLSFWRTPLIDKFLAKASRKYCIISDDFISLFRPHLEPPLMLGAMCCRSESLVSIGYRFHDLTFWIYSFNFTSLLGSPFNLLFFGMWFYSFSSVM